MWCQPQREQARTESVADGWHAEDGLRDASLNKHYADAYRLSSTEIFLRYVRGLRDGRALLRIGSVGRIVPDVTAETSTRGYADEMGGSPKEKSDGCSTRQLLREKR